MTTVHGEARKTGWTVDDSTFGARLALVRQRMDWNIKEAAVACGLPPASWRSWERDGARPHRLIEIAAIIAERTGCDYGWLLDPKRLKGGTGETSAAGNTLRYWPAGKRPNPIVSEPPDDQPAGGKDRPTPAEHRPPRGPRNAAPSPSLRRPALLARPSAT